MLFRQLFDRETCTYTYVLGCESSREAIIIDPVLEQVDRDCGLIKEWGLCLKWSIETHVHADHVTGAARLRDQCGCQCGVAQAGAAQGVDWELVHGDRVPFGQHSVEVRATPGHTASCLSYYVEEAGMIFTGDALFVRGCGRTDFQQGDAGQLYRSVHEQILSLPDDTKIYPGHDYKGRTVTTVAEEKAYNPRLGGGNTVEDFVSIMANLNLSLPARIDVAVPANLRCGLTEGSG